MKIWILFIFIIIAITKNYSQEDSLIYIFDSNENDLHSYFDYYDFFNPSIEEVFFSDSLANIYIQKNYDKYHWTNEIDNYFDYYRQYVGLIDTLESKIIFINAACEILNSDELMNNLIMVRGGGSCYFTLKVNLTTNECFDLKVNAPK
jgi:hypothetical protein